MIRKYQNPKNLKSEKQIIQLALNTLDIEAKAIKDLKKNITQQFFNCVKLIHFSKGRVIITGIGKSAIIAQKIVATFNSTGTPAVFMHAADAVHGDLGIIQREDIVICISKSGNTPEIKVLVPLLKGSGNKLIAFVGDTQSFLANQADYVLNTVVAKEACPNNLAPTSSTTAQLAMGDALAVCLLEYKGFTQKDFARFHPGGALGKKLYLKVSDIYPHNAKPQVNPSEKIENVILKISAERLGATAVINKGKLAGIITDGDLRRMIQKFGLSGKIIASDIMNKSPKTIEKSAMASDALELMKKHNITQLVVIEKNKFLGFIHLHDILKEGIL